MKFENAYITEKEIRKRVVALGRQITSDYKDCSERLVLVGVLKGSTVFFADLIREIDLDITVEFLAISSYGMSHQSSGEVRVLKDLDASIDGVNLIIVEDIVDTGLTLQYLKKVLGGREPKSIRVATLLDKPSRRKTEISADYVGFSVPNEFVVGYGLDYGQKFRNLKEIYILDKSVYTKQ